MTKPKVRCAIYARTSTEEGLAQEFNSLDAQIEAGRAYIASQASEGWTALKQCFVDGGYSGGSLERPALKEMLAAIARGEIDVVVIYKVDRLTRSLADFAKIVETLDKAGASFVSVTQSFSTTTSMGRLTLNVLLSFAQFEREVTAERIRDKFAASKARGLWMGGCPPLGYDVHERSLVINAAEAERVRLIFKLYLELKAMSLLADELQKQSVLSKGWTSRAGVVRPSVPIGEGALAVILSNPLYRGLIRHKDKTYPGQHEAIIDRDLWDAVQALRVQIKPPADAMPKLIDGALLNGRVVDDSGHAMRINFATKGAKRYRYYVSAALLDRHENPGSLPRLSAGTLDAAVLSELTPLLDRYWKPDWPANVRAISALKEVRVGARSLSFTVAADAIDPLSIPADGERRGVEIVFERPISLAKPRNTTNIVRTGDTPKRVDRVLVRSLALAHHWCKQLETGAKGSIVNLVEDGGRCIHHTKKLLPLAYLAPDLVEMILEGRQPRTMTLSALTAQPLPLDWAAQRALMQRLA